MSVQDTLKRALQDLERTGTSQPTECDAIAEAHAWLARTETLLAWIAKHPKLVEINSEAAVLLLRYRGISG